MATKLFRVFARTKPTLVDSMQMEPMSSRDATSDTGQFYYYEPKIEVLKKALPWVLAMGFFSLALLAILIALVFPNGLNEDATPTTTPALTTTYKSLATVG